MCHVSSQLALHDALPQVAWALRSTVSAGTKYSPATLVFGRDMTINSLIPVNWQAIKNKREAKAEKDNVREKKN